jgi:hypothetical protein
MPFRKTSRSRSGNVEPDFPGHRPSGNIFFSRFSACYQQLPATAAAFVPPEIWWAAAILKLGRRVAIFDIRFRHPHCPTGPRNLPLRCSFKTARVARFRTANLLTPLNRLHQKPRARAVRCLTSARHPLSRTAAAPPPHFQRLPKRQWRCPGNAAPTTPANIAPALGSPPPAPSPPAGENKDRAEIPAPAAPGPLFPSARFRPPARLW